MSAILPCPHCELMPSVCICDLSKKKVIYCLPARIIVTPEDVSLSIPFGGATVDQLRDMIPTLKAWSDRIHQYQEFQPHDPLRRLFDARAEGMGYGAIAKMFNSRWEDRRKQFMETDNAGIRREIEATSLFEMTRLGLSLDAANAAWAGDRQFSSTFPLTKSRVVGKLNRKTP